VQQCSELHSERMAMQHVVLLQVCADICMMHAVRSVCSQRFRPFCPVPPQLQQPCGVPGSVYVIIMSSCA
jgi:hypothetical protein